MLAMPQRCAVFFSDIFTSSRTNERRHSSSDIFNLLQQLTTPKRFWFLHSVGDALASLQIRFARQSDLKGICLVENSSFTDPYPHGLIDRLLRESSSSFLVAESPLGTMVGYCVAAVMGKDAHLISVAVLPAYRRRGIGTALIRRLLVCLSSRVNELRLEIKQGNVEALTLYESLGFRRLEFIPNYYEDGATAVKMLLTFPTASTNSAGSNPK